jgi:putative ABC transport system ATP-binding protein
MEDKETVDSPRMGNGHDIELGPFGAKESERTEKAGEPDLEEVIIEANNVHKTYLLGVEGVPALRGVTLKIKRGEFVVILGKSGGGKTSLLNIIGTIDKPTKGDLLICGKTITNKTTDQEFALLRLRKIGFVFQTFNLIATMTALENVSLPMILDGRRTRAEIRKRATTLLESVGMGARLGHLPSQLSGGEQQRTTIARAIANEPEILLLDEPTGDLDTHNSHIILNLLMDLNRKRHITCIMVTHDQALKSYAHKVVHMMDGKVLRLEEIPQSVREEMDHNLRGLLEKKSGGDSSDRKATTEYRDPNTFYRFKTHPIRSTIS